MKKRPLQPELVLYVFLTMKINMEENNTKTETGDAADAGGTEAMDSGLILNAM